ncbi:tRNA lysidine(34) synthetase TilS [Leifsonia sp. ALI-44-B]|nr:tRNA lysidine(34) synthetase TilS [Leifsonia sp. ALI-44-B]
MPPSARPEHRRPLDPATAEVRAAVRRSLAAHVAGAPVAEATVAGAVDAAHAPARMPDAASSATADDLAPLVLVALSGGPDSLALAAAVAFEAPKLGIRAGAVIVDHALQFGSEDVAARAAEQAASLGLAPVIVKKVVVSWGSGPESAARHARYLAFAEVFAETGASHILIGHTLDDQAETVLLGLARGAGPASLRGMSELTDRYLRPLLGVHRETTHASCDALGLDAWTDPHNDEHRFSRVRVRKAVLPVLERELGPGVAEALARTADILREDSEALDRMVDEIIEEICEPAEAGIAVDVRALAVNPAALRNRIIRVVAAGEFGQYLNRAHTLEIARLVTDWRGQGPIDVPGISVAREGALLVFTARAHDEAEAELRADIP